MIKAAAAAVLAMAMAQPLAAAAADLTVDGVASGLDHFEVHPVARGLTAIVGGTDVASFAPKAIGNPFAGLTGTCFGAMELKANRLSGGGYCTFKDALGEAVALRWTALAPVTRGYRGRWDVLGGSGPWAGATGTGTFVALTNPETRGATTGVTGAVHLP